MQLQQKQIYLQLVDCKKTEATVQFDLLTISLEGIVIFTRQNVW